MKVVFGAAVIAATFAVAGAAIADPSQDALEAQIKALKAQNAALQKKINALEQAKSTRAQAAPAPTAAAVRVAPTVVMGQISSSKLLPSIPFPSISSEPCRAPGTTNSLQFECAGFSAYFGALAIKREQIGNSTIATPPTGTPGVLISGANFEPKWDNSPEAILRYRLGGGWSVEGRYFNSKPDASTYVVPAVTTFRISGIGVTILGGGSIDSSYKSDLQSREANLVKEVIPGVSALIGYRDFDFHENLQNLLGGTGLNLGSWDESNKLRGVQVGAKLSFWAPSLPIKFDATAKYGSYGNSASNVATSNIVAQASDAAHVRSHATEANLSASYYFTPDISLQASYMALWIDNVALADRAASTTTQTGGGTSSPLNYGKVWYNAASLRLGVDF